MAKKWTEEQRVYALSIADATSAAEASKQTGIPRGTILSWMATINQDPINQSDQSIKVSKRVKGVTDEAIERAKESVAQIVVDQSTELANRILSMVRLAIEKSEQALIAGPNEGEPMAGWLKATAGVMHLGVEKAQLLTGKPTSRSEIKGELALKEEHTQRIVHELFAAYPDEENRWLMAGERAKLPKVGEPME